MILSCASATIGWAQTDVPKHPLEQRPKKEERNMEQYAGPARFRLPDGWMDQSTYSYTSHDRQLKVTLFFDNAVDEPTADAALADRLATAREVLPGFKLVGEAVPIQIAGREGRTVTFESKDANQVTRTRLAILMRAPRQALVVTAQGPAGQLDNFERMWDTLFASFVLQQR
jgi:hypothetical protein